MSDLPLQSLPLHEDECLSGRWSTVSGLDPQLVVELRKSREAREARLREQQEEETPEERRQWLGRIAQALGLLRK